MMVWFAYGLPHCMLDTTDPVSAFSVLEFLENINSGFDLILRKYLFAIWLWFGSNAISFFHIAT